MASLVHANVDKFLIKHLKYFNKANEAVSYSGDR